MMKHVFTSEDIQLKRSLVLLLQLFQYPFIYASFTIIFLCFSNHGIYFDINGYKITSWDSFKPFFCQSKQLSHYSVSEHMYFSLENVDQSQENKTCIVKWKWLSNDINCAPSIFPTVIANNKDSRMDLQKFLWKL